MTLNQRIDAVLGSIFPEVDRSSPIGHFELSSNIYTALALSRLFWPDVVVIDDAAFVVLHEGDARQVENRMSAQKSSTDGSMEWRVFVESFNRFEVRHLFRSWSGFPEVSSEAEFLLAEILVEIWSARLRSLFTDREFSAFIEDPVSEEGPCVVVSQIRPVLAAPEGWTG